VADLPVTLRCIALTNHPEKKIGQGMLAVAMILALILMPMFFAQVEENDRNPNQSPASVVSSNSVEVVLERNRAGHYVTSGLINEIPVDFLLDTGATDVVIPAHLAKDLGLKAGYKSRAMTANGPVTVYATVINELEIGKIKLTDVRASINPAMNAQGILLGMSALRKVEFVQRGKFLTIKQYH